MSFVMAKFYLKNFHIQYISIDFDVALYYRTYALTGDKFCVPFKIQSIIKSGRSRFWSILLAHPTF